MHGFVLVVLNGPDTAYACLEAAAQIAGAMNEARIAALYIRVDPASTILPSEEVLTGERRAQLENRAAQRAAAVNLIYQSWLGEHDDWTEGRSSWSDPLSTVQHEIRTRAAAPISLCWHHRRACEISTGTKQ